MSVAHINSAVVLEHTLYGKWNSTMEQLLIHNLWSMKPCAVMKFIDVFSQELIWVYKVILRRIRREESWVQRCFKVEICRCNSHAGLGFYLIRLMCTVFGGVNCEWSHVQFTQKNKIKKQRCNSNALGPFYGGPTLPKSIINKEKNNLMNKLMPLNAPKKY